MYKTNKVKLQKTAELKDIGGKFCVTSSTIKIEMFKKTKYWVIIIIPH